MECGNIIAGAWEFTFLNRKTFAMEHTVENRKFDLEERLIDFAALIIEVTESLANTRAGNHLAGQLVRSGTSPALQYGEAQSAESRNDFINKLKIESGDPRRVCNRCSCCRRHR